MSKVKTLVYLNPKFQDFEFVGAVSSMKSSKLFELVYANGLEEDSIIEGQFGCVKAETTPVKNYQLSEFDALLLIGGQHCQSLREDDIFEEIANFFVQEKKLIFAICDAPNVLFEKGIIPAETKYTSFPLEKGNFGINRSNKLLEFDQKVRLLSAKDPWSALGFGKAIVKIARQNLGLE